MPSGAKTRSISKGPNFICTKAFPRENLFSQFIVQHKAKVFESSSDAPAIFAVLAWVNIDILGGAWVTQEDRTALADKHVVNAVRSECSGHFLSLRGVELIARHRSPFS